MHKPILCLDFDGVIHSYTSGWKGADVIPDPPVPGTAEFIRKALKDFRVAIFSSRSNQPGGIDAMRAWCAKHLPGVGETAKHPGFLDEIEWPTEKPAAFVTIDDRALCFNGNWDNYDPEWLLGFKPWNKP
jgi:hypothetical protein